MSFGFNVFIAAVSVLYPSRATREGWTLKKWHEELTGFLDRIHGGYRGIPAVNTAVGAARIRCQQSYNDQKTAHAGVEDQDPKATGAAAAAAATAKKSIERYLKAANAAATAVQAAYIPDTKVTQHNRGGFAGGGGCSCEGFAVVNGVVHSLGAQTVKRAARDKHAEEQWFDATDLQKQPELTTKLRSIEAPARGAALVAPNLTRIEFNITLPVCGNVGNYCEARLETMRTSLTAIGHPNAPILIFTERQDDPFPVMQRVYEVGAASITGYGYWV